MSRLFTSESVMPGHPDKMCDRIADEILDAIIEAQPSDRKNLARSAVEVMALPGMVVIGGEVTCDGYVDIPAIARKAIKACDYDGPEFGFDGNTCGIVTAINEQSPDIAQAVNREGLKALGAGDQGLMFGYACNETEGLMPLPITLAHQLALLISGPGRGIKAKDGGPLFGPDGKTQVTVEYNEKGEPVGIDTIVVSVQHRAETELEEIKEVVNDLIIPAVRKQYPQEWFSDCHVMVNPSGRFVRGGPNADSGLTGRKIIVDTYGGMARHGGGSFSGKDPTKLDRSGAYMARHIAKSVVGSRLAHCCEVQLAYAIGRPEPVSLRVDTFGTAVRDIDDRDIECEVVGNFDLTPGGIIEGLRLFDGEVVRYADYSAFGHFGRFMAPWEEMKKLEVW